MLILGAFYVAEKRFSVFFLKFCLCESEVDTYFFLLLILDLKSSFWEKLTASLCVTVVFLVIACLYFVIMSFCVLLARSTSITPVFPVFCFPSVFTGSSSSCQSCLPRAPMLVPRPSWFFLVFLICSSRFSCFLCFVFFRFWISHWTWAH